MQRGKITEREKREIRRMHNNNNMSLTQIVQETGISRSNVWFFTSPISEQYPTLYKYKLARLNGKTDEELQEEIAEKKGFNSIQEYRQYLREKRLSNENIIDENEYKRTLAQQRTNLPRNKTFAKMIKTRLRRLNKNQAWLAKQLNVSRESVSNYCRGESMPKQDRLYELYDSLGIDYKK